MAEVVDVEVRTYVKELIAGVLGLAPNTIGDGELLADRGVNSIDLIDIVVKLESRYQVRFDPEKMKDLTCRSLSDNVIASAGYARICAPP